MDPVDERRFVGGVPPTPDGVMSDEDRRHVAGIYPFVPYDTPPSGTLRALSGTLSVTAQHSATVSIVRV